MSSFMADLNEISSVRGNAASGVTIKKKGENMDLNMQDFLTLMITEMTNQGIDSSMDTSDMVNQMVQMQMVTALANMTDASIMSYAASLVGKEVTVAQYNADNKLEELVGTVIGTGTKDGEQVIFLDNDKYYYMSEIMAVGRLPKKEEEDDKKDEGTGDVTDPGTTEGTGGTGSTEGTGGTGSTEGTGNGGETTETGNTEQTPGTGETDEAPAGRDETTGRAFVPDAPAVSDTETEYHGESGVPTDTEI